MAVPTKEAVEAFLASMGNTADEVADWLRTRQITGGHRVDDCPIWVALVREFGDEFRTVSLPAAVHAFIARFDTESAYPDLEATS